MSTVPMPVPRHALGMPRGSVRAILALMVVALVCALMLIPPREDKPIVIPSYLLYLLFLVVGHYFAARGHARGEGNAWGSQPLNLPRGCIRLTILVALTATCIYRWTSDPEGFKAQWLASVKALEEAPLLPVIVLLGFFAGALLRMVIGDQPPPAWQDMEAWVSLIAVILMAASAMIHLVINLSLPENLDPWLLEGILSGVVAFYFGERS
ncbi:MAG TPA: hypothetical protein VE988_16760 [Gemmataceae bacterium]|nr:hypothetical protein [Gemmataceae bacterium]